MMGGPKDKEEEAYQKGYAHGYETGVKIATEE